jgi:hypothetical protein
VLVDHKRNGIWTNYRKKQLIKEMRKQSELGWISYILGNNTANSAAAILPNMERHCPKHPEAEVRIWRYIRTTDR